MTVLSLISYIIQNTILSLISYMIQNIYSVSSALHVNVLKDIGIVNSYNTLVKSLIAYPHWYFQLL